MQDYLLCIHMLRSCVAKHMDKTHKLITVSVCMSLNVFCGSSLYLKSPSIGMNCVRVCVRTRLGGGGGRWREREREREGKEGERVSIQTKFSQIKTYIIELMNHTKRGNFWHPKPESEPTIYNTLGCNSL